MATKQYELDVKMRDREENPNSLRGRGLIPGVMYGPGIENRELTAKREDLEDLLAQITRSSRVKLNLDNKESFETFIRDIQYNDLTDAIIHIDFYRPKQKEDMEMDIPIIVKNIAEGEKEGGILNRITNTVTVKGFPTNIPEAIYVDISEMEIGDVIHVSDLELAEVEILTPPGRAVVTIAAPLTEEEMEEIIMGVEEEVPLMEEELLEEMEEEEEAKEELEEGEEPEEGEVEAEIEEEGT